MSVDAPKTVITSAKLQFALAAFAVVTILWQGASLYNEVSFKTLANERDITLLKAKQDEVERVYALKQEQTEVKYTGRQEKLLEKIDKLSDRITELAVAISGSAATKGKIQ